MLKPAARLLVSFLLGGVLTLAVAWIGATLFRPDRAAWADSHRSLSSKTVHRVVESDTTMRDRVGWPLPALECEYELGVSPQGEPYARAVRGGIAIDLPPPVGGTGAVNIRAACAFARALPARPLPLGFLVDTLLYFALVSLLLTAPVVLTRIRARRGVGSSGT